MRDHTGIRALPPIAVCLPDLVTLIGTRGGNLEAMIRAAMCEMQIWQGNQILGFLKPGWTAGV
jgi:hypothetical protein